MKTILITGASSGIGCKTSIFLAEQGYSVYAGVRKEEDAKALSQKYSRIIPVFLDVTRESDIQNIFQKISSEIKQNEEFCLVNNAGIALASPMECVPLSELRRQFEVNFFGTVAVTQFFLPLIRQTRGRIVNISSISGRLTLPFLGPYSASKFALEALTDALRRELKDLGVKVVSINPGSVRTPIWGKGHSWRQQAESQYQQGGLEVYKDALKIFDRRVKESIQRAVPPQDVVKAIFTALKDENPKTRYFVGGRTRFKDFLARHLPDKVMDYFIGRIFRKNV